MKILYKCNCVLPELKNSSLVSISRIDGHFYYSYNLNLDEKFIYSFIIQWTTNMDDYYNKILMFLRTTKLNKLLYKKINSTDMDEFMIFLQYYYTNRYDIDLIIPIEKDIKYINKLKGITEY